MVPKMPDHTGSKPDQLFPLEILAYSLYKLAETIVYARTYRLA
jgi:hypothetical protein